MNDKNSAMHVDYGITRKQGMVEFLLEAVKPRPMWSTIEISRDQATCIPE